MRKLPTPTDFFWLIFLLLVFCTVSCGSSRHITKSQSTTDSTWNNERRALLEQQDAMARKIESLTLDSTAVVVEFDTLHIHDTITRNIVKFKDGKIIYAEGNIKRVQAQADRSEARADSVVMENHILRDSLATATGAVHTKIKTVEKIIHRGVPWWWIIIGIIIGWFAHKYWPVVRFRLFGK